MFSQTDKIRPEPGERSTVEDLESELGCRNIILSEDSSRVQLAYVHSEKESRVHNVELFVLTEKYNTSLSVSFSM